MGDDWGEVIMGNSPFAEYLKELEKSSNIDNDDLVPLLSQQILPPEDPIDNKPDSQPDIPSTKSTTNATPIDTILHKYTSKMYNTLYNLVLGSDLLHPEESIFLYDEESTEMQLKPDDEIGEMNMSFKKSLYDCGSLFKKFASQSRTTIGRVSIVVALIAWLTSSLVFSMVMITFSAVAIIFAYHFGILWLLNTQNSVEQKIQQVVENNKQYDSNVQKAMKAILEVELIARGYRLSSPLSPIERLEQSAKSRKSVHMRAKIAESLSKSCRLLREFSSAFFPLISQDLVTSFKEKSLTDNEQFSEEPTLAELKAAYYQYFLARSEFFTLTLLAFHNVSTTATPQTDWLHTLKEIAKWQQKTVNSFSVCLSQVQHENLEIKNCVRTEFWANLLLHKTQRTAHERFFSQSKDLKLLLQGIIARVSLCEENATKTEDTSQEAEANKMILAELVEHYQIIRRDLAQALELWDSGNILLLKMIDATANGTDDPQITELRSLIKDGPLQPAEDDTNMPPIEFLPVTTNEEEQDEKTFEAYTGPDSDSEEDPPKPPPAPVSFVPGVPPPPPPMGLKMVSKKKPKKTRAERLAEKAANPDKETVQRTIFPEMEAVNMIKELKDVLHLRKPQVKT